MANKSNERVTLPVLKKNSDVFVGLLFVLIIVFMVIPLPRFALDLLLSMSITLALTVILVAVYTTEPLEFSIFPSLLLLCTLFRLSLNVASTRLILLHGAEGPGAAGRVILSFGQFVVGGSYVVGIVVFLILVIINFIVITKGSSRIAEVAARFTLDAMPGKQMSIDADLNSGLIDEQEAKTRRKDIELEADFYGAMDGAAKFVSGDAKAGLLITMINILGGLAIGVFQQEMSVGEAARTYTLLTVGDGLVSQIPALIVSTAAGIIVSRTSSKEDLGATMTSQLTSRPRALAVAAGVLFFFALTPGMPKVPFFLLAVAMAAIAFYTWEYQKGQADRETVEEKEAVRGERETSAEDLVPVDYLEVELGYGLIPLVDVSQDGEFLGRIQSIRKQFATEMGFVVPPVHIRDNLQLGPDEYAIIMKGVRIAEGELKTGYILAMDPGTAKDKLEGIPTKEPAFGLPAKWITKENKARAQMLGYTVVDSATILATHLSEIIRSHADELIGRQEFQELIDNLARTHPKVVEELIPNMLGLGDVLKVVKDLLRERISIRDLLGILETLADWAPATKDVEMLTEYVRQGMARHITKQCQNAEGNMHVMNLGQDLEEMIQQSIQVTEHGKYVAIDPVSLQNILERIGKAIEQFMTQGLQPVVLCSSIVRRYFKQITERMFPSLLVISHNEIANNVSVKSIGTVRLDNAG